MVFDAELHCGSSIRGYDDERQLTDARVASVHQKSAVRGEIWEHCPARRRLRLRPRYVVRNITSATRGLTDTLGPACTFASRMQHAEDRECLSNGGLNPL